MSDVKKMGRPLKYAELEAKKEVKVETPTQPTLKSQELNHTALGIGKNEKGQWCVYRYDFNPLTQEIKLNEIINPGSRMGAVNKFKTIAGKFLVG